ncbi:MAG: hypothetical protein MUP03_03715, partial [Anaerolineales bacterium]|nr:hypothetical protein [Anaerolineales bacterium]
AGLTPDAPPPGADQWTGQQKQQQLDAQRAAAEAAAARYNATLPSYNVPVYDAGQATYRTPTGSPITYVTTGGSQSALNQLILPGAPTGQAAATPRQVAAQQGPTVSMTSAQYQQYLQATQAANAYNLTNPNYPAFLASQTPYQQQQAQAGWQIQVKGSVQGIAPAQQPSVKPPTAMPTNLPAYGTYAWGEEMSKQIQQYPSYEGTMSYWSSLAASAGYKDIIYPSQVEYLKSIGAIKETPVSIGPGTQALTIPANVYASADVAKFGKPTYDVVEYIPGIPTAADLVRYGYDPTMAKTIQSQMQQSSWYRPYQVATGNIGTWMTATGGYETIAGGQIVASSSQAFKIPYYNPQTDIVRPQTVAAYQVIPAAQLAPVPQPAAITAGVGAQGYAVTSIGPAAIAAATVLPGQQRIPTDVASAQATVKGWQESWIGPIVGAYGGFLGVAAGALGVSTPGQAAATSAFLTGLPAVGLLFGAEKGALEFFNRPVEDPRYATLMTNVAVLRSQGKTEEASEALQQAAASGVLIKTGEAYYPAQGMITTGAGQTNVAWSKVTKQYVGTEAGQEQWALGTQRMYEEAARGGTPFHYGLAGLAGVSEFLHGTATAVRERPFDVAVAGAEMAAFTLGLEGLGMLFPAGTMAISPTIMGIAPYAGTALIAAPSAYTIATSPSGTRVHKAGEELPYFAARLGGIELTQAAISGARYIVPKLSPFATTEVGSVPRTPGYSEQILYEQMGKETPLTKLMYYRETPSPLSQTVEGITGRVRGGIENIQRVTTPAGLRPGAIPGPGGKIDLLDIEYYTPRSTGSQPRLTMPQEEAGIIQTQEQFMASEAGQWLQRQQIPYTATEQQLIGKTVAQSQAYVESQAPGKGVPGMRPWDVWGPSPEPAPMGPWPGGRTVPTGATGAQLVYETPLLAGERTILEPKLTPPALESLAIARLGFTPFTLAQQAASLQMTAGERVVQVQPQIVSEPSFLGRQQVSGQFEVPWSAQSQVGRQATSDLTHQITGRQAIENVPITTFVPEQTQIPGQTQTPWQDIIPARTPFIDVPVVPVVYQPPPPIVPTTQTPPFFPGFSWPPSGGGGGFGIPGPLKSAKVWSRLGLDIATFGGGHVPEFPRLPKFKASKMKRRKGKK